MRVCLAALILAKLDGSPQKKAITSAPAGNVSPSLLARSRPRILPPSQGR